MKILEESSRNRNSKSSSRKKNNIVISQSDQNFITFTKCEKDIYLSGNRYPNTKFQK